MDISDLRKIGKRLREDIPSFLYNFHESRPIARGAGGDLTYPVDKRAEDIIFKELEGLQRPLSVISEEYGIKEMQGGGPHLLIDPIDGSKNALTGLPVFSTSIALVEGNTLEKTRMGYIINLVNGDEFWAESGKGCFFNGMAVQTQKDGELRIVAYETQTPGIDIPKIIPVLSLFRRTRCLGSVALDMALLAQGTVSTFINPAPSRSFDFASGYLLIKEAGGIITNLEGEGIEETPVGVKKITPLLASGNEELHKKVLEALRTKS